MDATSRNLDIIIKNLPDIAKAAFSAKNAERFIQLIENVNDMSEETVDFLEGFMQDVGACVSLVLDIVKEPLQAAGYDLPVSRDFGPHNMRGYFDKEIEKRTILEHYRYDTTH